jgi:hypothetical protein
MKKARFFIFIFAFFFLSGNALSQTQGQSVIDSLLALLTKSKEDSGKIKLFERLSAAYYPISPDTGIIFGNDALKLAQKVKWEKLIGRSYNSIGVNYWAKSDYILAMEYYLKALKHGEQQKDSSLITAALGNVGTII